MAPTRRRLARGASSPCSATDRALLRRRGRFKLASTGEHHRVFTTRVDTIYGAHCVISPPAPAHATLLDAEGQAAPRPWWTRAPAAGCPLGRATFEKEGFGPPATSPSTLQRRTGPGVDRNFVLMGYGTGAIMAVPAHDERDFRFCRKYGILISPVIRPVDGALAVEPGMTQAFVDDGVVENSGEWSVPGERRSAPQMSATRAERLRQGCRYLRIKDWGISRQRLLGGTPHSGDSLPGCASCGSGRPASGTAAGPHQITGAGRRRLKTCRSSST